MKIGSTDIVNCKIGSTQVNEVRIGSTLVWQFSSVDPDAQAFITAAGITNPTQQTAINTLVVSLKANGIWTKMKAIYPFVGGTAFSHKFNLKNPLDTNAAFRLVFSGGWTHSANGAQPNGTNGYADTFFAPSSNLTISSSHFSKYNRTNDLTGIKVDGVIDNSITQTFFQHNYTAANGVIGEVGGIVSYTQTDTRGLFTVIRTATNSSKVFKNTTQQGTTNTTTITYLPNTNIYIGARNAGVGQFFNTYQCAFSSIGDGLTDTDASNLYTAVQAFNTSLGRSVGPQTVSDADAQAFVTAANIQDQVQADAVNNLVIGLKADGLWTKMKAIYPFVGGDATSHKWNLKNPLDTNAAFRLVFNGGIVHNANGITLNGTNGFADTYFNANTNNLTNGHISIYNKTNNAGSYYDFSNLTGPTEQTIIIKFTDNKYYINSGSQTYPNYLNSDARGLYQMNYNTTNVKGYRNGSLVITENKVSTGVNNLYSIGRNSSGQYSNRNYAFASIGDGLTDTDASNLYTNVQAFQTTLGRQI